LTMSVPAYEFESEWEGEYEGELEYEGEYEGEYESEYEGELEGEEFFGNLARLARRAVQSPQLRRVALTAARGALRSGLGSNIGSLVGGLLPQSEFEGETEGELEGEYMLGRARRAMSALPLLMGLAGSAGQLGADIARGAPLPVVQRDLNNVLVTGTELTRRATGSNQPAPPGYPPPAGGWPPPVPSQAPTMNVPPANRRRQREFEGEWEGEMMIERAANPQRRAAALMAHLAHQATQTESEAEAEAFIGALVPLASAILPRIAPLVARAMPGLARGVMSVTRTLRSNPATRQLVRTVPTIVQRTTANIAQQSAQGRPVTPQTAVRALAQQTARVLGSPQQSVQAYRQARALDRQYHRTVATAGPRANGRRPCTCG
jgi:hypothetical protein